MLLDEDEPANMKFSSEIFKLSLNPNIESGWQTATQLS